MMTKTIAQAALAALALSFFAGAASAGPIESACLRSDRGAANRGLCGCIQQVADFTLRGGDQRRVAGFFKDPEKAQTVKMSKSNSDDAFWDRYTAFTAQAEAYCAAQ
jgi:hypothetical protein